ncbi:MAG: hypothetical protein AAFQ94_19075 [Bacteroidota bacterium]
MKKEFPAFNLRQTYNAYIFWCLVLMIIITTVPALLTENLVVAGFLGAFGTIFTMLILDLWRSKILVDSFGIHRKSALFPKKIAWSEIKSVGVYQQISKYSSIQIYPENAEQETFDTIFIAVSRLPDYDPNSFRKSAAMRVHYYEELYHIILKQLNKDYP